MTMELIKKLSIVIFAIFIFRLGSHIPVPGVDPIALAAMFAQYDGTILDMFNTFSGGSLKRLSIFAIGIMPFISASIIIQLMGYFYPHFKELKEEGHKGQLKLAQYTRYLTLVLAFFQALGLTSSISGQVINGMPIVPNSGLSFMFVAISSLVAGTFILVWMGEKVTEYGIGNGISLLIYASIISSLPVAIAGTLELVNNNQITNGLLFIILSVIVLAIIFVIIVEKSQRRIPITYAKNNAQDINNQKSFLPFKINLAGIIPPILASSIILFPATLGAWFTDSGNVNIMSKIATYFSQGTITYIVLYSALIIAFSYFFTNLQHNPVNIANSLKDRNAFIPGFRPGDQTANYLKSLISKITFIGSIYLTLVCLLPEFLIYYWKVPFYFGGTSLLIIVMVALDWHTQITSLLKGKEYNKLEKDLFNDFGR